MEMRRVERKGIRDLRGAGIEAYADASRADIEAMRLRAATAARKHQDDLNAITLRGCRLNLVISVRVLSPLLSSVCRSLGEFSGCASAVRVVFSKENPAFGCDGVIQ